LEEFYLGLFQSTTPIIYLDWGKTRCFSQDSRQSCRDSNRLPSVYESWTLKLHQCTR